MKIIRNLLSDIRLFVIGLLHAIPEADHIREITNAGIEQFGLGHAAGVQDGRKMTVTKFGVLPLPLTEAQLRGMERGEFITVGGDFSVMFGECTIPAPGQHGYEQRGYYVSREALFDSPNTHDLHCHAKHKFTNPADSDELVPVIVTVLR